MKRWIYADVETTGVGPDDRIVELAWIEFNEDFEELDRFRTRVDPEMPISPSAMGVHHITDAMVTDAPTIREVFEVVKPNAFSSGDEVTLCAHNAQFDARFIAPHIPIKECLCTLRLARHFWPDAPDHKLQTLRYLYELQGGEGAHGALQDCETGLALLSFIGLEKGYTLDRLRELCQKPLTLIRMPFGKHKGAYLRDIPKGYRVWLLGSDIDPDLRYSLEHL
jgi:exodeoxyribonuclease X